MLSRLFFVATLFTSTAVSATCYHDGVPYTTGDIVGDYVCATNGTWRAR